MNIQIKIIHLSIFALLGLAAFIAAPEALSQDAVDANNSATIGSCPAANNACNDPNGCLLLNQRVYRVYQGGMAQCTWGLGGCTNYIPRPCYEKFNVVDCTPPSPSSYGSGTMVDENACR